MNCLKNFRPHMRYHKGSTTSFLSLRACLLVCLSLILSVLILITSCSLPWETQETTAGTDVSVILTGDTTLDRYSLVRELATCISDSSQIEYVYHSIPAAQLDGMSYASFNAYILALTRLHVIAGPITSFRFVAQTESQKIIDAIATNAADYKPLLESTIPVELFYGNELSNEAPVYIYIQEDTNGTAYLSSTWVRECLNVFDFAGLYFGALEKQNFEAVASLIKDSQVPSEGEFSAAVINYKSRELTQYYHLKVQSPFSDYRMMSLDISQLTYLQPEVLDDISLSYQTRNVSFVRNSLNSISIRDSVNTMLSTKDFFLYHKGIKTIRIGDRADSNQFISLFGDPNGISFGMQFVPKTNTAADQQIIEISYPSTSVTIRGTFYDDGSWDGQIIRIRLNKADMNYFLGTTLYVGVTRDTLLMLYPFADQTDYILSTTVDDQRYQMSFTFTEDPTRTITSVTLELVE